MKGLKHMSYHIITTIDGQHVDDLYGLYKQEWWSDKRKFEDVLRMLENTDVLIGICDNETNKLIGFARVLSDFVYKALILDVIVHEDYQGKGLGGLLLDQIITQPKLQSVQSFELYCKSDKMSFYEKWGFTEKLGDLNLMRKNFQG